MPKNTTPPSGIAAAPESTTPDEPCNVAVETIGTRRKVGKAICSGVVPFGITMTEAKLLEELRHVKITGIFTEPSTEG